MLTSCEIAIYSSVLAIFSFSFYNLLILSLLGLGRSMVLNLSQFLYCQSVVILTP